MRITYLQWGKEREMRNIDKVTLEGGRVHFVCGGHAYAIEFEYVVKIEEEEE